MKVQLLLATVVMISILFSLSYATPSLTVVGPTSAVLTNNQGVYLGKVGPGESFYVLASASTPNATGYVVNIGWDQLNATNLPPGWQSQSSLLYENPMKIKITVPTDAAIGSYNLTLHAVNTQNYSKLGNITVYAHVNVTPYVFSVKVQPNVIQSGVNQPTNIYVTINNTGISDYPFSINLQGLPAWNVTDQVVALHLTQSAYVYPIYVAEAGKYRFNLTVSSTTNPSLAIAFPMNLTARSSLLNDYSAVGQGVTLSPVIFDPTYEVMLFLSYLYKSVIH